MQPRNDSLKIPEGSSRYFSIDLDEWRRVQLAGAAAEIVKLDEEIPALAKELEKPKPKATPKKDSIEEVARGLLEDEHQLKKYRHERLTGLIATLEPLPKRGLHHFKFPSYSKGNAFASWADTGTDPGLSLYFSVLVGLFWSHRGTRLEAKLPARATSERWDEYAEAVEEELQEAGYTSQEISLMGGQCDELLGAWMRGLTKAKVKADFTEVKGD